MIGNDYDRLPEGLREEARNYVEAGFLPGRFLRAVLANDFSRAIGNLPPGLTTEDLCAVQRWKTFDCPVDAHGSEATVASYIERISEQIAIRKVWARGIVSHG